MHVPYLCCRWDAVDLGLQSQWAVGRWKHSGQVLADADHSARLHCVCQHLIGVFSFRSAMFRCVCAVRRSAGSVRALTCSLLVLGPLTRLRLFFGNVRVPVRCAVCIPEAKSIARPSVSVPSSVLIRSHPPPSPPLPRVYTGQSACTAHTPSCTGSQSVTVALVCFVAAKLPLRSRAAPCSGVCSTAKGPRVGGFSGDQGRTPSSTHVPDHRPSAHVEV